ncbi:MAG: hypothetical protein NT062_30600, partial [Proteobacteria bacterium]|nr:hypothetical protein [Pseudomonadota bacterium]
MIARGQIALVASLAMHAVAVVAIAARPLVPDPIPRAATTVDLVVPAPADEPIVEVALVDTSALAPMPPPPASAVPRGRDGSLEGAPRRPSMPAPIDRAAIATAG